MTSFTLHQTLQTIKGDIDMSRVSSDPYQRFMLSATFGKDKDGLKLDEIKQIDKKFFANALIYSAMNQVASYQFNEVIALYNSDSQVTNKDFSKEIWSYILSSAAGNSSEVLTTAWDLFKANRGNVILDKEGGNLF